MSVLSEDEAAGGEGETIWVEVEEDGKLHSCASPGQPVDGWGRGKIEVWIPVVLDGESRRVLIGADEKLIGDCLAQLHEVLWTPSPSSRE